METQNKLAENSSIKSLFVRGNKTNELQRSPSRQRFNPNSIFTRLDSIHESKGPDHEVTRRFSYSTKLITKFVLLVNVKILSIAISYLLNMAEHEYFSADKYENANYCWHFHIH